MVKTQINNLRFKGENMITINIVGGKSYTIDYCSGMNAIGC
jgi:hypothetical protein